MSNQSFINSIVSGAKEGYVTYLVFASVTIAQAINESGWGKSSLAKTDNNLFGIKFPGKHDPSIKITKGSYATDDGGYYCHYQSTNDSMLDHGYFLAHNSRYAAALTAKTNDAQIKAIAAAGYATASNYYSITMGIINDNKLSQYDNGGKEATTTPSSTSGQLDVVSTNFQVDANSELYGDILYGRKYRIIISDAVGNAFEVTDLRCTYSIVKTMVMEPNMSLIVIYNLSAETENTIMMNSSRVTVEAGYEGSQFGLIFDGDILQTLRDKPDAATYELTIVALDSDKSVNFDIANYSVLKGQTARTLVDHITNSAQYPVTLGSISQGLSDTSTLTRGKVFFGKSSDYLRQIAQSNNAQYYMDNGQINIIKMADLPDGQIFDLNVATGLLGTPQQTTYGISGKCLLNPAIKINTLIHVDNSLVRAQQINLTSSNSIPSSGSSTSTDSLDTSTAGTTVRNKIIAEAKKVCDDPNVGYSEGLRNQTVNGKTYYDCSSFVVHCYKAAGLSIVDITGPQWIAVQPAQGGKVITISDAKPGDVVFWFNGSGCYHVAIYAGNNNVYAASTSRKAWAKQVAEEPIYGNYQIGRIPALIASDAGQAPSATGTTTDTGTQSPVFRSLDKDGIYRIIKVTYTGDTRGTDWSCDFETVDQAGGVIAAVTN